MVQRDHQLTKKFNAKSLFIGAALGTGLSIAYLNCDYLIDIADHEHHSYDAAHFMDIPAQSLVQTETLTSSARNWDSYSFSNVPGLTQKELDILVNEHHARIMPSAYAAEDYHYYPRSFEDIIKGHEVVDLVKKMDPNKDYTAAELKKMVEREVGVMLGKLDYRSYYITHETAQRWALEENNINYAFGFQFLDHPDGLIVDFVHDGPAKADGLKAGFVITQINDHDFTALDMAARRIILLDAKSSGKETIFKGVNSIDGKPFTVKTTAGEVHTTPVRASMVGDETLVIKLDAFTHGSGDLFREAFEEAAEKYGDQIKNIVIDLRDNGGGFVYAVNQMLDDFTDGVKLGYTKERLGPGSFLKRIFMDTDGDYSIEHIPSRKGQVTDLPISILVNNRSASASEVFAGNMQDVGRATVIGQTASYGKATMQMPFGLDIAKDDQPEINITVGALFLPKSGSYQGIGIQPDILVQPKNLVDSSNLRFEKDNPNILKNPSGNTPKDSPFTCSMRLDAEGQLKDIWVDHVDVSNAYKKQINLAADADLLCAIDSFKATPEHTNIEPNTPKPLS